MKPNKEQISETRAILEKRLANPVMNKMANRHVKEGYEESVKILSEQSETYDGIERLNSVQSRAIAMLAVDYLLGDCTQKILVNVPVKPF